MLNKRIECDSFPQSAEWPSERTQAFHPTQIGRALPDVSGTDHDLNSDVGESGGIAFRPHLLEAREFDRPACRACAIPARVLADVQVPSREGPASGLEDGGVSGECVYLLAFTASGKHSAQSSLTLCPVAPLCQ